MEIVNEITDEHLSYHAEAAPGLRAPKHDFHFDWTILANGRLYRLVMRASHRLGFCWPEDTPVEPGRVWCHWCGMRGYRPLSVSPHSAASPSVDTTEGDGRG